MAIANNIFNRCDTKEKMDDLYYSLTSPENLYADGERSHQQAMDLAKEYNNHYQHRLAEIQIAHLNQVRLSGSK